MAQVSTHTQGRTVWAEVKTGPFRGFTRGGKSRSDALRNLARALCREEDAVNNLKTKLTHLQRNVDKLVDRAA